MAKALECVYLTAIEGANLNAAGTDGVISVLKKTEDIDGSVLIRISGQSVKYQIRQIWREMNLPVSPVIARKAAAEKVIVSEGNPRKYIDDDLFGYMIERGDKEKKKNRKRTAVVRTNGMISLFPYKGDRDFGVRYDPQDPTGKHNIYEVELTTNVMRGNLFVELDRLGKFEPHELAASKGAELSSKEKEKRLQALFDALFNFFGGAHLSNYFTKTYSEVILFAILNRKLPVIGDKLRVEAKKSDGKYNIKIDLLKEAITIFDDVIEEILIGGYETIIANWEDVKKLSSKKIKVFTLENLKKEIKKRIFFT